MAVEIEAKMAVENLVAVRDRLRECGGRPLGIFFETNTFFDNDDRTLLAADKGLRLRLSRNTGTDEEDHIITWKGPRQHGPLKSREEVELAVEGSAEATKLLECLGFQKMLSFEKRRESWELDGCRVELDEVPFLGTFVEVEGPDDAAVLRVRQTLHLGDRPLIKYGYVALLTGYLQERGRSERAIRFADV
ncbi:MAG TPA: class IV adenylate cyclase [Tepidisphaeraceae bacterium]|nr:class IV adenylate cyclase [Tepidisphaeraceae bacterium]